MREEKKENSIQSTVGLGATLRGWLIPTIMPATVNMTTNVATTKKKASEFSMDGPVLTPCLTNSIFFGSCVGKSVSMNCSIWRPSALAPRPR